MISASAASIELFVAEPHAGQFERSTMLGDVFEEASADFGLGIGDVRSAPEKVVSGFAICNIRCGLLESPQIQLRRAALCRQKMR